jgi:hypothetical protein
MISDEEVRQAGYSFNYTGAQWKAIADAFEDCFRDRVEAAQIKAIRFECEHDYRHDWIKKIEVPNVEALQIKAVRFECDHDYRNDWIEEIKLPNLLLEFACTYRRNFPHYRPVAERTKILRRQIKAASEFRAAIAEAESVPHDDWNLFPEETRRQLLSLIDFFVQSRTYSIEELNAIGRLQCFAQSRAAVLPAHPRAVYFHDLIQLWVMLGGRLTYSRDSATKKPGGPLIRYMQAVTKPVMEKAAPTAEGIVKLISRERNWRKLAADLSRTKLEEAR